MTAPRRTYRATVEFLPHHRVERVELVSDHLPTLLAAVEDYRREHAPDLRVTLTAGPS